MPPFVEGIKEQKQWKVQKPMERVERTGVEISRTREEFVEILARLLGEQRSSSLNSSFLGSSLSPSGYELRRIISYLFASYLLKSFLRR